MRTMRFAALVALLIAVPSAAAAAEPPAFIRPYPGQEPWKSEVKEFDEFELPTGVDPKGRVMTSTHLEGRVSFYSYSHPQGRSTLEVARNYREALEKAGFRILYYCKPCQDATNKLLENLSYEAETGQPTHYMAARLSRPSGDTWAGVRVMASRGIMGGTRIVVVETKPMETGKVAVTAEALASDISQQGHVAVYGIYFDTDKSEIKPESAPALEQIGALLRKSPSMKLWVVGHTDTVGAILHNMELSKRRAEAVVRELTGKHKIEAVRLSAGGVGPYAPVATNRSEDGRAKNRRVELVEQ